MGSNSNIQINFRNLPIIMEATFSTKLYPHQCFSIMTCNTNNNYAYKLPTQLNSKQNPFTRDRIVPHHRKQGYPYSTSEDKMRIHRLKTQSPFKWKSPNVVQIGHGYEQDFLLKERKSCSVFTRQSTRLYQQQHLDMGWLSNQSFKRRQVDRRQRQIQIERKRADIFGVQILRYIPNNEQQKNTDYFGNNRREGNKLQPQSVFTQSQSIYSGNNSSSKVTSHFGKNSQKKQKMDKKKIKKMLSWNKETQKQNKNINKGIYKQINSENKLGLDDNYNSKIGSKEKIEKSNNKSRLQSNWNTQQLNLYNRDIEIRKNFQDSFGNNKQLANYLQVPIKVSKLDGRCSSIFRPDQRHQEKKKNKMQLKEKKQELQDHIMEMSDGFKFQESSPNSSLGSFNQDLIKFPQGNNMFYQSSSKFQSFLVKRISQLQSSSGGSSMSKNSRNSANNLNLFFSSISEQLVKNKELMMSFRSMFADSNSLNEKTGKQDHQHPSIIKYQDRDFQMIPL